MQAAPRYLPVLFFLKKHIIDKRTSVNAIISEILIYISINNLSIFYKKSIKEFTNEFNYIKRKAG